MKISKMHLIVLGMAVALIGAVADPGSQAIAKSDTSKKSTPSATYQYVAQAGDSYTKLARKATQTYGITEKVRLSPAQIIFIETNLTQAAGEPELAENGQTSIAKSEVATWAKKATKLSSDELAAWESYVPLVAFDTRSVGEAS